MVGQRAAISAESEVARRRHRMSRAARRTPALLLARAFEVAGKGGSALCSFVSAVLARGVCAVTPLFFYAAEIAAARMLLFFRKSARMDILTIGASPEVHTSLCERLEVQFLWPTRPGQSQIGTT